MSETHDQLATIERYYDACNTGDVEGIVAECTADVVHYFLPAGVAAVAGAEHLGRYWRKVQRALDGRWLVDHALVGNDEAVIEWSLLFTSAAGERHVVRGAEWYQFRDGKIAEIRAYYDQRPDASTGLEGFPYAARGYTIPVPTGA